MCNFYAPVMAGETYRLAEPVAEYGAAYAAGLGNAADAGRMLSCNCILNFLYAELEGKRIGTASSVPSPSGKLPTSC